MFACRFATRQLVSFAGCSFHLKVKTAAVSSHLLHRAFALNMDVNWKPPAPCKVGDPTSATDTPALVVDMDIMEANLRQMGSVMKKYPGVACRPHAKAHKCPALARLQVEHGAVGLCTQTLVETEALVYVGGIEDVYLTNQVIGRAKLQRLAALAKLAKVSVCVDDVENIRDISTVAQEAGVTIDCVVEVNVGQDRAGVEPGQPAVGLAQELLNLPAVTFKGLHCYQGWNQHIRRTDDRDQAVAGVVEKVKVTLEALSSANIPCNYVTGGGTGSFEYEAKSGVYTEVQPGSYVIMDVDYSKNLTSDGQLDNTFKNSMFVYTTVQSVTAGDRAVVDAGMKAASMDSGAPVVNEHPDLVYHIGGDEHGILRPSGPLKVGDQLFLIPGHCDPTVNLHDWLIGIRGGKVEVLWPITGRGPGV